MNIMSNTRVKILSKNDTGETGSHQAGIAVPKSNSKLISFFPQLNSDEFNPETWLHCKDPDGEEWKLRYIYYNGKTFNPPKSTRNEYRITHMTKFFKKYRVTSSDRLIFSRTEKTAHYKIRIKTSDAVPSNQPIKLSGWSDVC